MINRSHRFHGHGSLRFVYQRGKTVRGSYGALKYIYNSRRHTYRMAVVISRKVHKSAVVRNRIRRRIFEAVRVREADISQPYDIVFTVFSDQVATLLAAELQARIYEKLEETGIMMPKGASHSGDRGIVKDEES